MDCRDLTIANFNECWQHVPITTMFWWLTGISISLFCVAVFWVIATTSDTRKDK